MWLTKLEQLADPKYGLTVKFESGWKRRGASGGAQMKAVQGVLWHHDVAPRSGTYPLRAMLRDGRKGLSGPLCHIGFDRDGVVHVVGAGKANHAGTGKVPGVVRNGGNTRLIGIEMTSTGRGDWTAAQLREMPKLGRALNAIFGLDTSQHWSHREYSDSGKIDPYGLPGGMAGLRDRIRAAYTGGLAGPGGGMSAPLAPTAKADPERPWLTSPRVKGMTATQVRGIQAAVGVKVDGKYGDATGGAVKQLQEAVGLTADGIYGPTTEAAMATLDDINKKVDRLIAFGEQIHWRVDAKLPAQINVAQAAIIEAIQESGRAQGFTDAQVQQIATAAAEAAGRVSAEDVAGHLTVTTRGE